MRRRATAKVISIEDIPVSPARTGQPDTAHYAAAIGGKIRSTQRVKIFNLLREEGLDNGTNGYTDFEMHKLLGIVRTGSCKRRFELSQFGLVGDSGRRRPTDTETDAVVWVITKAGMLYDGSLTLSAITPTEPQEKKRISFKTVKRLHAYYERKFHEDPSEFFDTARLSLGWVLGKNKPPK